MTRGIFTRDDPPSTKEGIVRAIGVILAAAMLAACAKSDDAATSDSVATATPDTDADVAPSGATGLPAGYTGRSDRGGPLTEAKYVESNGRWDITTGPAHIIYAAKDSASGTYTASATIDQQANPAHPEAFGIFVGGRNLDQPDQTYTYLVVRGTGEALVKVMEGTTPRTVMDWSANAAIPKADASGKASYRVAIAVGADSVRFMVNDTPVGAVAAGSVPTDGVAGLRVNHNLHVLASPVTISR